VSVPGAGVDPLKVIRPSKRIKAMHRSRAVGGLSLKAFARLTSDPIARMWLLSKAVRP
jgi:hypothetical protein